MKITDMHLNGEGEVTLGQIVDHFADAFDNQGMAQRMASTVKASNIDPKVARALIYAGAYYHRQHPAALVIIEGQTMAVPLPIISTATAKPPYKPSKCKSLRSAMHSDGIDRTGQDRPAISINALCKGRGELEQVQGNALQKVQGIALQSKDRALPCKITAIRYCGMV